MSPAIRTCSLPCIAAKIDIDESTGEISTKCPKGCPFAKYEDRPGPLDKYMGAEE